MHVKSFPSKDHGPSQKKDRLFIKPGVSEGQGKKIFSGCCIHEITTSMDGFSRSVKEKARKYYSMNDAVFHFASCIIEEVLRTNDF